MGFDNLLFDASFPFSLCLMKEMCYQNYNEPKSINWKYNFKILIDSVENCTRQWTNARKKTDVDTLPNGLRLWVRWYKSDIAPNNSVFVYKSHDINCLINELSIDNSVGNSTYTLTTLTKEEELDLPSLYWIPKLHKCHYKQRYVAGSSNCSTKPLSKLLTTIHLEKSIATLPLKAMHM